MFISFDRERDEGDRPTFADSENTDDKAITHRDIEYSENKREGLGPFPSPRDQQPLEPIVDNIIEVFDVVGLLSRYLRA